MQYRYTFQWAFRYNSLKEEEETYYKAYVQNEGQTIFVCAVLRGVVILMIHLKFTYSVNASTYFEA